MVHRFNNNMNCTITIPIVRIFTWKSFDGPECPRGNSDLLSPVLGQPKFFFDLCTSVAGCIIFPLLNHSNMKTTILASLFMLFLNPAGIYSFKMNTVDGESQINFSDFKGKKILIVNTACKSPYTFQFTGMQQLYSAYKEKLVVVALPAGDAFGDQELKTNSEIRDFCRYSYGISFPVAEKVVLNGSLRHPLIQYLLDEAKKLGMEEPVIKGNFTKFILDENGVLVKVFPADVQPMSTEITAILDNDNSWKL